MNKHMECVKRVVVGLPSAPAIVIRSFLAGALVLAVCGGIILAAWPLFISLWQYLGWI